MTIRLIPKASDILRLSSLIRGLTVSFAEKPSKIYYTPCYIRFFNNFPKQHGGFITPRLFLRNSLAWKVQLKQFTDVTADEDGEFFSDYTPEKTRLYPDHDCELINQVLAATSLEDILKLNIDVSSMNLKLASQTVVTVNELLRSVYPQQFDEYSAALQHVQCSSVFQRCLEILENEFSDLPDFILMDVFLSLRHMISADHMLFTKCLIKCQELIPHLPPKDLSKFCIVMLKSEKRYLPLVAPAIGQISTHIEDCKTEEDIRNLAICFGSGFMYTSSDSLNRFAKQVEAFVLSGKELEFKTAVYCLNVLSLADNNLNSVELQHLLISFLIGFVPKLNTAEIRQLCQSISHAKCNIDLMVAAIEERLNVLLQESRTVSETISLLNCANQHASSLKHKFFVSDCIKKHQEFYDVREAYYISMLISSLYSMFPLQNKELSLHLLNLCCSQNLPIKFLRKVVKKLVHFRIISGSAMAGENVPKFTDLCYYLAENSVICYDIALFSSFIITDLSSTVPVTLIQRLNSILLQLNIRSLSLVSKSISTASTNAHLVSQTHQKELANLSSNLLRRLISLLPSCKNLTEYNIILRSISDITSRALPAGRPKKAMIYHSLYSEYSSYLENENFKINDIISSCKTISHLRICLPHVLDAVAQCIVEHPSTQSVKAITYALQACYSVNYKPQVQEFLTKCQDIILSGSQLISCQGLLQSALCLGLNGTLSDKIIRLIFSEDFLDRLEKELSVCSTSQERTIRMAFAQLNKIACLDYPDKNVPWFHEKFCKALALKENRRLNEFEKEVYKVLCQILRRKEFIQMKVYTPYHYLISFEVLLDKSNSPLENRDENTSGSDIQRVAVDVLPENHYCRNTSQLTGHAWLKKKHLETLGYKLVQVPFFEWNSIQLQNNNSRIDYLYTKIFQSAGE